MNYTLFNLNDKPKGNDMLTATYTNDYKKIIVKFHTNDKIEVSTIGEVSELEIETAINAGGGIVAGWESDLY